MKRSVFLLAVILFISSNTQAETRNRKAALRYLNTAVEQCERGMKAAIPRSRVGLRVLKRYQKKYQRYHKMAVDLDPSLQEHKGVYYGTYFTDKTYQQVFDVCGIDLNEKIAKATASLDQKHKAYSGQGASSPAQKWARAKKEAGTAIQRYCAEYLRQPQGRADKNSLARLNLAKTTYNLSKRNALSIYPDIAQSKLEASILGEDGKTLDKSIKTIDEWFNYCDGVFEEYASALTILLEQQDTVEEDVAVSDEAPADEATAETTGDEVAVVDEVPVDDGAAGEVPMEDEVPVEDESPADGGEDFAGDDEDLKEMLAMVKGDRAAVLKAEGRTPDYTSDDDNPHKAKTWQYESDEGDKCKVYSFKGDKQSGAPKTIKGECP